MKKRYMYVLAVVVCVAVASGALVLGSLLNTISFEGNIVPGASMSKAVVLDLGNMTTNSTGGSGPNLEGSPFDANASLTVPVITNVTLSFPNVSELSVFAAFSCLVQLYQNGSPVFEGIIYQNVTSYKILSVAEGTYEIWVGYTYTAGASPAAST